jgi:hypothetical protein
MRISTITIGAAFIAAAAMSACASRGVVPSQSFGSADNAGAIAMATKATPTPNACMKTSPPMYYFGGACSNFTMANTKATVVDLGKYNPYGGIKIDTTYSKNSGATVGTPAVMGDATGVGDITGTVGGKAFKKYGDGNDCIGANGKPTKCFGKTFVYAELINNSNYTLTPAATPGFVITDTHGFPGKSCFPAIYSSAGWTPEGNLEAAPKGDTLTLPSANNTGQLHYVKHAQFIVAGVCE